MCLWDFVRDSLFDLSIYWDPRDLAFSYYRLFAIVLGVKFNLICHKKNILVAKKFFDLFFRLAYDITISVILTHNKLYIYNSSITWIIVTIDFHFFLIYTSKLSLVCIEFKLAFFVKRQELAVGTFETKILSSTHSWWNDFSCFLNYSLFIRSPWIMRKL